VIPERKRDADHQYEKALRIVEQAVKGNTKATEALHDLDSAVGSMLNQAGELGHVTGFVVLGRIKGMPLEQIVATANV
jgi:hypothetical protein